MSTRELLIFGTVHVAAAESTKERLEQFAEQVDGFCIEAPHSYPSARDSLSAVTRNPAVFIGGMLYGIILLLVQRFRSDPRRGLEEAVTTEIAEQNGIDVHCVDVNRATWIGGIPLYFVPVSWLLTLTGLFTGLVSVAAISMTAYRTAFVLFAITAAVFILPFWTQVWRTESNRDELMLERTQQICEREGYDSVCLVVGDSHREGIAELADDYGFHVRDQEGTSRMAGLLGT